MILSFSEVWSHVTRMIYYELGIHPNGAAGSAATYYGAAYTLLSCFLLLSQARRTSSLLLECFSFRFHDVGSSEGFIDDDSGRTYFRGSSAQIILEMSVSPVIKERSQSEESGARRGSAKDHVAGVMISDRCSI